MSQSPDFRDERSALLDTDQNVAPESATSNSSFKSPFWIVISLAIVMLLLDMSNFVGVAPETAILEDIICSKYYGALFLPGDEFDDERCKIEPVQSELALLNGWKEALETIPGILCAVPYGALADRIGRKRVLLLSLIGCFLSDTWIRIVCWFPNIFPLRAIWLSGGWQLLGGGATTMTSMLFVMVADVCPAEKRTTAFSQIHAAFLASEILSVPIGAILMTINPWIPYLGASFIFTLGSCLAILVIPETLATTDAVHSTDDITLIPSGIQSKSLVVSYLRKKFGQLSDAGRWMGYNANVILILCTFFVSQLGRQVVGVLLQYSSKKFHWSYAQASYLISLRAGVSLILLSVLIPGLSNLLVGRLKVSPIVRDKTITQISGFFLALGSTITFLATSPLMLVLGQFLFALGFAFGVTARSLITSLVEQQHRGSLYTGISTMTYIGVFAGGPLLAKSFSWGMKLGAIWLGMPFLIAASLFMLATMAVSAVRLNGHRIPS